MFLRSVSLLVVVAACTGGAPTPAATKATPPPAEVKPAVAEPKPPSTTWLARFAGRESEEVEWVALAADGSTLAVGKAADRALVTTTFGAPVEANRLPTAGPDSASFVAKFGPHGEPGFVAGFAALEVATAVSPTSDGGALVVGLAHPPRVDGTERGPVQADTDAFVARFDAQGEQVWRHTIGGSGTQELWHAVALPSGSDHVVAGMTTGMAAYSGDTTAVGASHDKFMRGGPDAFVARIAEDGQMRWSGAVDGVGEAYAQGLAVGGDGAVVLTGEFRETAQVRGSMGMGATVECGAETLGIFVAVWEVDGRVRWARRVPGPHKDIQTPESAAVLSDGDVAVAGMFRDGLGGGEGLPALTNPTAPDRDGFVARFARADGAPRWIRHLRGSQPTPARAAAAGADGSVWVMAEFHGDMEVGDGERYAKVELRGELNPVLLRFDAAGERTYAELLGGKAPLGTALAEADSGSVVVNHMAVGTGDRLRVAGGFGGRMASQPVPGGPLEIEALLQTDGFVIARPAPR